MTTYIVPGGDFITCDDGRGPGDPIDTRTLAQRAHDAAVERLISCALRTARAAHRPTPSSRPDMRFDPNRLFQLAPGDAGYRERRPARAHALDAEPGSSREHIEHARNHVAAVMSGSSELDIDRLRGYLDRALAALGETDAEDDRADGRLHEDEVTDPVGHGGPPHVRARAEDDEDDDRDEFGPRLDSRRRGRDAMGETAPRSSISTRGLRSRVDHRRDFADRPQGGAESGADGAHGCDGSGYNPDSLFQRSGTR